MQSTMMMRRMALLMPRARLLSTAAAASAAETPITVTKRFTTTTTKKKKSIQSLRQAKLEASRCLQCIDKPCSKACPAGTDPARFIRQVIMDNPEGAAETILNSNALGGTCGAVCPVSHLCEGVCTRQKLDSGRPVRIGALQEFLHRWGAHPATAAAAVGSSSSSSTTTKASPILREPCKLPMNGKTVAVVGSGPGGLSTARELQRLGFQVTIYETRKEPGGALRYLLSPNRMDHELVEEEIKRIQNLGVTIQCNHPIHDVSKLQQQYDHVIVAPGMQQGKTLSHLNIRKEEEVGGDDDVKGGELLSAIDFLYSSNTDQEKAISLVKGKRVIVIGGGSVAMDAAVTSKSLGADDVTVVFPESLATMVADPDEIDLAKDHFVTFLPERYIESWTTETETKTETKTGKNGSGCGGGEAHIRHSQTNKEEILAADTILMAIGQEIPKDTKTSLMNQPGIWYVGDASNGGKTVVQSVAEGKQVADRISIESGNGMTLDQLNTVGRKAEEDEALKIDFCGITFPNPFNLSSSPVSNTADMCARAFDAGWGGVVYKTLNIEDDLKVLHPSPRLGAVHDNSESSRMGIGIQNVEQISDRKLADNLKDIDWLKNHYPNNIVGVSVMGLSEDGWKTLARAAEDNGADWIELNFSCPQMHAASSGHKVGQNFDLIEQFTAAAKSSCSIPVVAKMTPNLTDMVPAALAAQNGGADGVSAVNTFKAISHIGFSYSNTQQNYTPQPNIQGASAISGFSGSACRPLALRFIAEMAQEQKLVIPISGMGGLYTWRDATEFLSLGASHLQCTTAVMRHGIDIVEDLKDGLLRHLRLLGHRNVQDIVGSSLPYLQSPEQLDLSTEAVSFVNDDLCIGCGACVTSCKYGAANAISMKDGVARIDPELCVGCLLCQHVCPVQDAIGSSIRPRISRSM